MGLTFIFRIASFPGGAAGHFMLQAGLGRLIHFLPRLLLPHHCVVLLPLHQAFGLRAGDLLHALLGGRVVCSLYQRVPLLQGGSLC